MDRWQVSTQKAKAPGSQNQKGDAEPPCQEPRSAPHSDPAKHPQ